ncbi:MAG: hypothetical protein R3E73_09630 [Porticoccaceae bacterium]
MPVKKPAKRSATEQAPAAEKSTPNDGMPVPEEITSNAAPQGTMTSGTKPQAENDVEQERSPDNDSNVETEEKPTDISFDDKTLTGDSTPENKEAESYADKIEPTEESVAEKALETVSPSKPASDITEAQQTAESIPETKALTTVSESEQDLDTSSDNKALDVVQPSSETGEISRPNNDPRANPKPVTTVEITSIVNDRPPSKPLDTSQPAQVSLEPSEHVRPGNDPRLKRVSKPVPTENLAERQLDLEMSEPEVKEDNS